MLFGHRRPDTEASELLERIQRLEEEHLKLRARVEADAHLHRLMAEAHAAADAGLTIGSAFEAFAASMRRPLARGRAGGLARAARAWRNDDGTFISEEERECVIEEAEAEEYEMRAAGGRARAASARRRGDGTFAPND